MAAGERELRRNRQLEPMSGWPLQGVRHVGAALVLTLVASCCVLESPELEAEKQAKVVATADPLRLRLATWNIEHLRSTGKPPLRRNAKDFARLAHYAERLDADVVALQEVGEMEAAELVFNPQQYRVVLSGKMDVQRTGFALRRGLHFERHPDFVRLDVGGLRRGVDLELHLGAGQRLRLLSIHLKSGCFFGSIRGTAAACRKFAQQVPVLEEWVDARAREGVPFAVLGDFNRRLNRSDPVWLDWDDGEPVNADLLLVTEGRRSGCEGGRYPDYIDHILLGKQAVPWYAAESFAQVVFEERGTSSVRLSDHCPISIVLETSK